MIKYVLLVFLIVLLVVNYLSKRILGAVIKGEPTQKQEVIYKTVLYVITVAVAICVMIIG